MLGYPDCVSKYYAEHSAEEINGIRLPAVEELLEKNSRYYPGILLQPHGWRVIALAANGDVFCIAPTLQVYIVDHGLGTDAPSITLAYLQKHAVQVAASFEEFLIRWRAQALPGDYYQARRLGPQVSEFIAQYREALTRLAGWLDLNDDPSIRATVTEYAEQHPEIRDFLNSVMAIEDKEQRNAMTRLIRAGLGK